MRAEQQTYAISTACFQRRRIFQRESNASLLLDTIFRYRDQGRYLLHAFAIMPDHLHVLITPMNDQTIERCVQCIKGGFSFAIRNDFKGEIWQAGFHEHRVRDIEDYLRQADYIANNPGRLGGFSHRNMSSALDPMPSRLK